MSDRFETPELSVNIPVGRRHGDLEALFEDYKRGLALTGKSYGYPPLSGQDGDPANLNNVALGKQYVDVFKNANELGKAAGAAALKLCADPKTLALTIPDGLVDKSVAPTAGLTATDFKTPGGVTVKSFILQPTPLTADTLQTAIDAGQISKADLCKGVDAATAPPACK